MKRGYQQAPLCVACHHPRSCHPMSKKPRGGITITCSFGFRLMRHAGSTEVIRPCVCDLTQAALRKLQGVGGPGWHLRATLARKESDSPGPHGG